MQFKELIRNFTKKNKLLNDFKSELNMIKDNYINLINKIKILK